MAQNKVKNDTLVLLFDSDEFILNQESENDLTRFTKTTFLKTTDSIFITGHTDYTGNLEYNKELSLKRAEAAKEFLQTKGWTIPFICSAKASFQPVSSDTSAVGKKQNRRVEIIVKRHKVILIQKVQVYPMTNDGFYTITTKNGCLLKISPNSVKTATADSIYIRITEYNNSAEYLANRIPMSYQSGDNVMMFDSEEMLKIEAFSAEKRELSLNKLFELDCPHVDTTGGLKFYKLNEINDNLDDLRFDYEYREVGKTVNPNLKDTGTVELNELIKIADAPEKKDVKSYKEFKAEKASKKKKSLRIKLPSISRTKRPKKKIELPIDTGRVHLIIDTGSVCLDLDTLRSYSHSAVYRCRPFDDSRLKPYSICTENEAINKLLVETKVILKDSTLDYNSFDFNTFCQRWKNLNYIRGVEKVNLSQEDIYKLAPKWRIRKRLFKKELRFKLNRFKDNREYKQLRKVKWTSYYGDFESNKEFVLTLKGKIVDFRVMDLYPNSVYGKDIHQYALQFKTENEFYSIPVKSKMDSKKLHQKIYRYQHSLDFKEDEFNRKVTKQLDDERIIPIVKLFQLMNQIAFARQYDCESGTWSGPFMFPSDIREILRPKFKGDSFLSYSYPMDILENLTEWLHSMDQFKFHLSTQIDYIQGDFENLQSVICQPVWCPPVEKKWEYSSLKNNGNGCVIRVGIGMYNFDRIYILGVKQTVFNPILIDENRNILLNKDNERHFQVYSVIPGIKGLLWHSKPPRFALISGKINVIYFHNRVTDQKYKVVYDLRNGESIQGNTVQVKDITEQAKTIRGLKEELEREDW